MYIVGGETWALNSVGIIQKLHVNVKWVTGTDEVHGIMELIKGKR